MKRTFERIILRSPKLYQFISRHRKHSNPDKYIFSQLVKRGDVVVDCGANIGSYTRFFRNLVGSEGFVHSFEPVPATFDELSKNLKSTITNIKLNNKGLFNKQKNEIIYLPDQTSGHASLTNHLNLWNANTIEEISVSLTTLDDYFDDNFIQVLDFMKIDIEGAELFAIQGSEQCLRKHKPILHIEINTRLLKNFDTDPGLIYSTLRQFGYERFTYYDDFPTKTSSFQTLIQNDQDIDVTLIAKM